MPTLQPACCGLSRRAIGFAEGLQQAGHTVEFLVAEDKTTFERGEVIQDLPIHAVPVERKLAPHWSLQARCRLSDAEQVLRCADEYYDLFISCQPEAITIAKRLWPTVPRLFVCGGVTILHDRADAQRLSDAGIATRIAFHLDRTLKHRNERTAFHTADAVVFDSQSTRRRVIAEYGLRSSRGHTIYAAVDGARFRMPSERERAEARQQLGLLNGDFCIAWTGRMSPEKNLGVLVGALEHLPVRFRLLLVGDGPLEREIRSQIAAVHLDDRVLLPGPMSDVRPALWAADCFAFPSVSESLGLSLIEAMSTGLACIALQADERQIRNASREILDGGKYGLLVQENKAEAFAAAIESLANDPVLRADFARVAMRRATAEFAWTTGQSRIVDLVERLACRFIGTGKRAQDVTVPVCGY